MGSAYDNETALVLMKLLPTTTVLAMLVGCGDPTPGEGVDSAIGEEPMPEVVSASEALQTPNISTLDPSTLQDAEISKVIPAGPMCRFAYTADSPPILAASVGQNGEIVGVIKLHGRLVRVAAPELRSYNALMNGGTFSAGDVSLEVHPEEQEDQRRSAEAHFSVGDQITVGYGGWYSCDRPG